MAGRDLWHTVPIERLGIPALKVSDGPNGARGESHSGQTSVCTPCGTALGASFDPELVRRVGEMLGSEARTKGARVLLAPTVNLHRSPLAGRNCECMSEDPELTARLAVAYVEGVQSRRVAACIKHFVCNDSEFERHSMSSEIAERPLRELYLRPFEAAVKQAGVRCVMSAYNRINGIHAADHQELLDGILRREWGFAGLVMSDWFGMHTTVEAAIAGLDLEMPGPTQHRGEKLVEAVRSGAVAEDLVNASARRVLELLEWSGALDEGPPARERSENLAEHRALARAAAVGSAVLLHNRDATLPLDPTRLKRLAVIGTLAETPSFQGGGSAQVSPHHLSIPLDELRERLGDRVEVGFERGTLIYRSTPPITRQVLADDAGAARGHAQLELFAGRELAGTPACVRTLPWLREQWLGAPAPDLTAGDFSARVRARLVVAESGRHTLALTCVGPGRVRLDGRLVIDGWDQEKRQPGETFFGFGCAELCSEVELEAGRPVDLEFEYACWKGLGIAGFVLGLLPPVHEDLAERAVALAAASDAAVVFVGTNLDWETEGRDRDSMALPGEQVALIEAVTAANPRTIVVINAGSPVLTDWVERTAATLVTWFPGQEAGGAIADLLLGVADPGGRLPQTWPRRYEDNPALGNYPGEFGKVHYGEGLLIGYRWYEARGIAPAFPFGHGLSYTTFEYGAVEASPHALGRDTPLEVAVTLRNTGSRLGSEVVQVYARALDAKVQRPPSELVGFAKVALEPGESRRVCVAVQPEAFRHWDPLQRDWGFEGGRFEIVVGRSATDRRGAAVVEIKP